MNKNITIVTGLWDLKRGDIQGWGKRDFQQYKDRFLNYSNLMLKCVFGFLKN